MDGLKALSDAAGRGEIARHTPQASYDDLTPADGADDRLKEAGMTQSKERWLAKEGVPYKDPAKAAGDLLEELADA